MLTLGFLTGVVLVFAVLVQRSFFWVPEGHAAVLSSFGAVVRQGGEDSPLRIYSPGLHGKAPWRDVHRVAMMEQNLDLSGDSRGLTAMTDDGTLLRFDSILRFGPQQDRLYDYLFGLRAPVEHITGMFSCLLRNEIANFNGHSADQPQDIGSYAVLRRERQKLHARIESFAKQRIGQHYGVRFHAVDLTDILPPDELADALNAVVSAQTEASALYARAEAESQQRVLAAERGVEIARQNAMAAADEARALAAHLEVLQRAGVLGAYIARRRAEVYGEARALFVREKEAA